MKTEKPRPVLSSNYGRLLRLKSTSVNMYSTELVRMFEDELKEIYWAEIALRETLPGFIEMARSQELIDALTSHLAETENQIIRLKQVFGFIGKNAETTICSTIAGLILEAEDIMETCERGSMCDAGIISIKQKMEHYEIISYRTLRQFTEALGLKEADWLLETTLNEELNMYEWLSETALSIYISEENRASASGNAYR